MGVSVQAPNLDGFSTGYFTFNNMRMEIAGFLGDDWRDHYEAMIMAPYDMDWDAYNAKTADMERWLSEDDKLVLDFLYASDCEGSLDAEHCRAVKHLMDYKHDAWRADTRSWAYQAYEPFTFADLYDLMEDGWKSGKGIEWY